MARDLQLRPTTGQLEDPRGWLEAVEAEECLQWVRASNADATAAIGEPTENPSYIRTLSILDSKEKIPYVGRVLNGLYYNFWQDDVHVRGIWRRCTLEEYCKPGPNWEAVLDLDVLSAEEGVTWVWAGSTVLDEGAGVPAELVLLKLSRGGSDACHVREFSLKAKQFIPEEEGGFVVGEAKSNVSYIDRTSIFIGTDMGEGSLTASGYPRQVREWKRGTKLSDALVVFEGEKEDVIAYAMHYRDRHVWHSCYRRMITFWTSETQMKMPDGNFMVVPVPEDAKLDTFADQLLIELRSDWQAGSRSYKAGSLLAVSLLAFMAGERSMTVLFEPTATSSLDGKAESYNFLILEVLDNVRCELRFWRCTFASSASSPGSASGTWHLDRTYKSEGDIATLSVRASDANLGDEIWVTTSSYIQPTNEFAPPPAMAFKTPTDGPARISLVSPRYAIAQASAPDEMEVVKSLPAFFDASELQVQQYFAVSKDGTSVPYFLVRKRHMRMDGSTPTLLYGYGGFEISLTPSYIATVGVGWLEKGGAYVQANIRGGGEFGPRWHQAALKEKRHKAYEDFEAVAKDLVARGITSSERLGIQGGSNGGLLMGNMLVRSPGLFGAIVCQVPLLDMRRFNTLLAGASWMGEYGDPDDPEQWAFLQKYSPYHLLRRGVTYPPILFTTSTRDDRVHPGHARKMVHKMKDLGLSSVFYYENIEGGHGGAADNKQRAFMSTLAYAFLHKTLKSRAFGPSTSPAGPPGEQPVLDAKWVTPLVCATAILALAAIELRRR